MNKRLILALAAAGAIACATAARAEVTVIVNPKNPATALTADQVAQIYLGKTASFPGGEPANAVNLAEGAPLRDELHQKAADKNPGQVKAYWAKQMFSGKGTPPREVANTSEMKKAVAADVAAIGYVDKASVDSTVKAVLTIP